MPPVDDELLIRDSIDVYFKAQGYRPPRFGQRLLAHSFAGETIQPAKVAAVTAKEIEAVLKSDRRSIGSLQTSATTISPSVSVRIFISHSSTDRELAALLVDLLRSSLNLPAEAIRCASVEGHRLAGGAETDRALRKDIRDCEGFIGLISATSIESAYVLFELGARWGAERHLLPLLAPTADAAILRGPLSGINALRCSSAADLQQMIHEIAGVLKISVEKPAAYQRHVEQILGLGAVKTSHSEPHIR
jgi:TIR domain